MDYFCILILNSEKEFDLNRENGNEGCCSQSLPSRYVFIYAEMPTPAMTPIINEMFAEKGFQLIQDGKMIPFEHEKLEAVGVIVSFEEDTAIPEFYCASYNEKLVHPFFPRVNSTPLAIEFYHLYEFVPDEYRLSMIEKLVAAYPDLPFRDSESKTLLQFAVKISHHALFDMLLKYGADVNRTKKNGKTLLHSAVKRNSEHSLYIVQTLLEKGANVNGEMVGRITPLHSAITARNPEFVRLLLEKGAKVNGVTTLNGRTPLHMAVRLLEDSDDHIVELLLQFDADMYARDAGGNTPILYATRSPRLLQLFLQKGVPLDFEISSEQTLLVLAVGEGWFESAEFILTLRPDPSLTGNSDAFSLVLKKDTEEHEKLANIMHQQGFTINPESFERSFYQSDLFLGAVRRGFVDVVQQLIDIGFDVKSKYYNASPLVVALEIGNEEMIRLLLEHGSSDTSSFIRKASFTLLEKMVKVKAIDVTDESLFKTTIDIKKPEVIELFLEEGSDPNFTTSVCTPLSTAAWYCDSAAIDVLEKFGGVIRVIDQFILVRHPGTILHCFPFPTDISSVEQDRIKVFIRYWGSDQQILQHMIKVEVVCPRFKVEDLVDASKYNVPALGLDVFRKKCELEFKIIKEEIDSSRVTYLDILTQDIHKISRYARNESIAKAMEPSIINTLFPIYSCHLSCRFQSGVKQRNLVDQAHLVLKAIFSKHCASLSDDTIGLIIVYLCNRDLVILQKYFPVKQASQTSS